MSAPALAPGHEDTDDAFDEAFKVFGTLQSMKGELKSIGGNFYDDIEKIAEKNEEKYKKDTANRIGQFINNLHVHKPDEDLLKNLIHEFPKSLQYKILPIHSVVWNLDSVGYIPLLAEQGIKCNFGGNGKRGGLLLEAHTDFGNMNVLQQLVFLINTNDPIPSNPITIDTTCLNIMKDLRDMNLLVKNDIKDHDLLYWACDSKAKLRFEFLADWSHSGLKSYKLDGLPIFHSIIKYCSITAGSFPTFLKASLNHHTQDSGLLFQKDQHGKTACEYAFDKYGKEGTFKVLTDLIPPDAPQFPILHHVAKHAPQYMDDFAIRYSSSIHTLDSFGCTISEDESQGRISASGGTHTSTYRINGTRVIGPDRAGLYPFMVAACGNTSDHLSAVYCLLRRDPSLVNGGRIDQQHSQMQEAKRGRRHHD